MAAGEDPFDGIGLEVVLHDRLVEGSREVGRIEDGGEVDEGSRDGRDGDPAPLGCVPPIDQAAAVDRHPPRSPVAHCQNFWQ
jgi:hypothetical protein